MPGNLGYAPHPSVIQWEQLIGQITPHASTQPETRQGKLHKLNQIALKAYLENR